MDMVLMDMVLTDQFRFINRSPAQDQSLQGVGFFHVRGTSCVDERYLVPAANNGRLIT